MTAPLVKPAKAGLNRTSSRITQPRSQGASQAMLLGTGLTPADLDKPHIYLGMTQAARKADLPLDKVKGWTFIKQARGKDIYLIGVDDTAGVKGATSRVKSSWTFSR